MGSRKVHAVIEGCPRGFTMELLYDLTLGVHEHVVKLYFKKTNMLEK